MTCHCESARYLANVTAYATGASRRIAELEAEVARLRAGLESIARFDPQWACGEARIVVSGIRVIAEMMLEATP